MGPAVRKLVEEHDLDPAAIEGSGREGRITKGDVLDYIADHQATHVGIEHDVRDRAPAAKPPSAPAPAPAAQPPRQDGSRNEHRVTMTRLRARIAERLLQAQQQAAMLTTFNEVDMTAVMALRQRYQEQFTAKHGIKLGFMSFFVKASVDALRQFPVLNASVDGNDIIYHEFFDIGVAVSTDRGLVVPVLRNAEAIGFAAIEQKIRDFGDRARKGSLQMEELTGGTFTITNGGIFGSLMSTPILNPPQSGILGMHKIQERAMVVGGKIEARPMMYLALTYDHRIVDGREAVQFLVHVKDLLEDPARLLLEI
jgi:2-oxoglutarate dehydrogenase E2 component (dihydrolipoamide succinyltransferase)